MAAKYSLKSNFSIESKYEAFYTGGKIQFSKDASHMFCGCGNKVEVIEIETGKIQHSIGKEEDSTVTSFAVSPDDQALVVASQHLILRQWDWRTQTVQRTWKAIHVTPVSSMTFDCTSTLLATGGSDSTIKIWDIIKQYCTHNLKGHQGVVSLVVFHPDISRLQLFSAADDYTIRMWDLTTSSCTHVFEGHFSAVTSLTFTKDGNTAYSSGRDNVVIVWDVIGKEKKKVIPIFEASETCILLPESKKFKKLNVKKGDDMHFITAGAKGILRVWNATTHNCVYTQESEESSPAIIQAQYIPSTCQIAIVTFDHNIKFCNLEDFDVTKQFAGYNDNILDLRFLGENDDKVVVVTNSEQLKVFDRSNWNCTMIPGHTDIVMCVDVSTKYDAIVTGSKDNTIRLWKYGKKAQCVAVGKGHTNTVNAVVLSKLHLDYIVSAGEDMTLKFWPIENLFDIKKSGTVSLISTLTELAHEKNINSVTVAPNDKFIATGSQDKTAKLWDAANLKLLGVFRGHRKGVWCVQFSPIDQALVTSSADSTIKIWSLTDLTCVKTFEGHEGSVLKVSFLVRGMQLISSGSDGLVKLWTIKDNECIKTFDEHDDKIWALAVSNNQEYLVSGGADSKLVLWKDVTEAEQLEVVNKQNDLILKEQTLSNYLIKKNYVKALGIAITLEQPFRVLKIIKEILSSEKGDNKLESTLKKLRMDQIDSILRFAVEWNTNSKHCHPAQFVISVVLKTLAPEQLMEMANIKSTLEGFIPYSERHFQRMNRLKQQAMFVDYTWQCVKPASAPSSYTDTGISPTVGFVIDKSSQPIQIDNEEKLSASNDEKNISSGASDDDDSPMENSSDEGNSSSYESEQGSAKDGDEIHETQLKRKTPRNQPPQYTPKLKLKRALPQSERRPQKKRIVNKRRKSIT